MAFRDFVDKARNFFGPNNTFFNGAREESEPMEEYYAPQNAQPQQVPYAVPPAPAYPQQPVYTQAGYQQNPYHQPAQQAYQQPAPVSQPQQQMYQHQPLQQGYQVPQTVNQPYVQPRNRRSAQHAQQAENVVPFPAAAQQQAAPQQPQPAQPAAQPQQPAAPAQGQSAAYVVNVRGIADCRKSIGILRTGDCVLTVMDNIADQAEVRRYVDTLNGACFSLGCTMTRLSARVGVYLLAPVGMQVFTDQATTQMNSQSRTPQRTRSAQAGFRVPYQAAAQFQYPPQQPAYAAPQQEYQQAQRPYAQQQPYEQVPYTAPQANPYQTPAPAFASQQPATGYTPDAAEGNEYADSVM